jgi:AraC family transcriptional regulator of adaptative response/methylated-DNA-[protein]-cysteine methyltransferase
MIAYACRTIEEAETTPSLAQLAAAAEMSLYHFHKLFVAQTRVTVHEYARVKRLPNGTAHRARHSTDTIRFALGGCWLGSLLVAASDRGVCAILLGDDPEHLLHDLERRFPKADLVGGDAAFEAHVARVAAFVAEPSAGLDLPLDIRGTAFQLRVWQVLRKVPAGSTISYRELARRLSRPQSARAVATACAANPLAVAIPCHRVVRTDGSLSGYRWGLERKRELLEREQARSSISPKGR